MALVRKVVTVLFCDLAGYTSTGDALDPEALRSLQERYFEDARTALERHGGTVEKFIGDAVMAVFGIPVLHEDDALRALRAAVELRDAVDALGFQARIGVNTGEVVAGSGDALVTRSTSPHASSRRPSRARSCSVSEPFSLPGTRSRSRPSSPSPRRESLSLSRRIASFVSSRARPPSSAASTRRSSVAERSWRACGWRSTGRSPNARRGS
jgi:hypothetical protein